MGALTASVMEQSKLVLVIITVRIKGVVAVMGKESIASGMDRVAWH